MFERLLLAVILIFPVFSSAAAAQAPAATEYRMVLEPITSAQAVSETDVYRPDKNDIISWMNQASKISAAQQNEMVDAALKNISGSGGKTPRSDFQLCLGLAYLGNAKAQRCAGSAYEKGIGIVDDTLEAYVWFELAHSGGSAESQADVSRVILILNSA